MSNSSQSGLLGGGNEDDPVFGGFALVQQLDRQEFEHLLESMLGVKELLVESALMRPLDRLVSMPVLKAHDCPRVQQLQPERSVNWHEETEHGVFLTRLTIPVAKKLCELVLATRQQTSGGDRPPQPVRLSMICVDGRRNFFDAELERHGLHGTVALYDFSFSFVLLESDLLSLELPQHYSNTYRKDAPLMAAALGRLQALYGPFSVIFGAGERARLTVDELDRATKKGPNKCGGFDDDSGGGQKRRKQQSAAFGTVLMFDRQMDLASVLLTGMTYESMLNDVFPYSCGKIVFGTRVEERLKKSSGPSPRKSPSPDDADAQQSFPGPLTGRAFLLNNADPIFAAIRNGHMASVLPYLSQRAKTLQSSIERASEINRVEEMKAFVANELRSLRDQQRHLEVHISACEVLLEQVRDSDRFTIEWALIKGDFDHSEVLVSVNNLIASGRFTAWSVLQLCCLWSLRAGGLPPKCYDQLEATFLRRYGVLAGSGGSGCGSGGSTMGLGTLVSLRQRGLLRPTTGGGVLQSAIISTTLLPIHKGLNALAQQTTAAVSRKPRAMSSAETSSSMAGGELGASNQRIGSIAENSFLRPSSSTPASAAAATSGSSSGNNCRSLEALISGLKLCPEVEASGATAHTSQWKPPEIGVGFDCHAPSYVFSDAFTPAVCRLAELALRAHRQRALLAANPHHRKTSKLGAASDEGWDSARLGKLLDYDTMFARFRQEVGEAVEMPRTLTVCVLGQITHAEVAALRALARRERVRLLVLTTALLHRERFLASD